MIRIFKSIAVSALMLIQLVLGTSVYFFALPSSAVFAAEGDPCSTSASFLGLPTWYKYLRAQEDATGRCSPVLSGDTVEGQVNSALPIGLAILEGFLRISGLVAVVMIFWAAFKFIASQGNPDEATAARKTAINAMIGLTIVIVATALVSFVGNSLLPS